jgi:hypothetical protein
VARAYDLACVLALAAAAAGGDATLEPAARATQVDRLAGRALQQLERARAAGYFQAEANLDHLKSDPDLDPLRSRPDFQALLLDLAFPAQPFQAGPPSRSAVAPQRGASAVVVIEGSLAKATVSTTRGPESR